MEDLIHYRRADGGILAGPIGCDSYGIWTNCCVRGCHTRLTMPADAVQAWCWKCHPQNTKSWREIHLARLRRRAEEEHARWVRFNTGWTTFEQIEGMAAVLRKYSPPRPPEGPLGGDTFPVSYPEDPEEAWSFARADATVAGADHADAPRWSFARADATGSLCDAPPPVRLF